MNISYIEVNTQSLERDAQELSGYIESASGCLKGLLETAKAVNADWEGAANAMFINRLAEDMEFLGEVLKETSELAECMGFAGQEYVKCENDVANVIEAVRI